VIGISNAEARQMTSVGSRRDRIYGELTSHGLVHIWADTEKTDNCFAHILVIGKWSVAAQSHTYNRRAQMYNQGREAGKTFEVPLIDNSDPIEMMTHEQMYDSGLTMDLDEAKKVHGRVERTLAKFATIGREYDALHQTVARRYPLVHQNLEQLYPYAGHIFGPRINLMEMYRAGVPFHLGVEEAIKLAPEMAIDS
jgi:hypothetical protein